MSYLFEYFYQILAWQNQTYQPPNKTCFGPPFTESEPFCVLGDYTCKYEIKLKKDHEKVKLWEQLTG